MANELDDKKQDIKELDLKRLALEGALSATETLINQFENVVRGCYVAPEASSSNFSEVSHKLYPEPVEALDEMGSSEYKHRSTFAIFAEPEKDERCHMSMQALITDALSCKRCTLCSTRTNVVFGEGCSDRPTVMVIGEGPGETEDNTGRPFVGKAGAFLDKWLKAINLDRNSNTYITNIVKCRPPQNRDPLPEEKTACLAFLKQQIALIQPQTILCLGRPASSLMTGQEDASMGSLRGRFFFFDGIPMICTYHPAAVLRDLSLKRPVWEDLQKLARYLGLEVMGSR